MNHYERNFIEILRRLGDVESKLTGIGNNKTTVSYGAATSQTSGKDHRLLANLNSEDCIELITTDANKEFTVASSIGAIDIF